MSDIAENYAAGTAAAWEAKVARDITGDEAELEYERSVENRKWWLRHPHTFEGQGSLCRKCNAPVHSHRWATWCWTCTEYHEIDIETGLQAEPCGGKE